MRRAGFSLIEVMIVLVILSVIVAQAFLVFSTQRRVYLSTDRALEVQESARLITDLIAYDTRMAAFMLPRFAGVASWDGGAANPDRLCMSESSYFSTPVDGTPSATMDNRGDRFSGASVTTLTFPNVILATSDLDIDGSGAPQAIDFIQNAGIIFTDGVRTWCTRILSVDALGQVSVAHSPAFAFTPGNTIAVPAIIYENDPVAMTLTRNGMLLSATVEDLQVEFWVDAQIPDGVIGGNEFPINDLNDTTLGWTVDPEMIRRVQISVLTRSTQGDALDGEVLNRYRRPQIANRLAGARDDLPRRRFTVSVLPRNIL